MIECKNASKDEAIALGVDQIRRYHDETPEVMVPEMLFTATEAIGFAYGVTWNLDPAQHLQLEARGDREPRGEGQELLRHPPGPSLPQGLHPLRGERRGAAEVHSPPAPDRGRRQGRRPAHSIPKRSRGLVWHTQGSGKTYTMIKAAELLFKANEAHKPTILLMIDRNELEDQMLKNLASLGMANVAHADRIASLNKLLTSPDRTTAASSSR